MHQSGEDLNQVLFRNILLRMRDGQVTKEDWQHLMKQTPAQVQDLEQFRNALHLYPTVEAVAEHNVTKLHSSGQPIATVKATHTGANASKASPDDAAGLDPVVCIAHGARVMLTSNFWTEFGLVNGAMGTVIAICYKSSQAPPNLPVSVMVQFDCYRGPTLHDGTVPIAPICHTWSASSAQCSCLQLPLFCCSIVYIHKLKLL